MTSSKDRMQAALAAAIAAKRAAQSPLGSDQLDTFWTAEAARHIRAERAHKAQRDGRRTPMPRRRSEALPPAQSRMWSKAMSLDAARDQRLSMGARTALAVIRALVEAGEPIRRTGLAALLGVSARTAQRYISQLRQHGYITTRLVCKASGWVTGQLIHLAQKVLPYFLRPAEPHQSGRAQGETIPTPNNLTIINLIQQPNQYRPLRLSVGLIPVPQHLGAGGT